MQISRVHSPSLFRISLASVAAVAATLGVAGCSTQRPVLYPNAQLESAGAAQAQQDVDDCLALAESAGAGGSRAASVAGRTATSGAVGAAGGAAVGAVRGNVGRGAAVGAAGGAAGGFMAGLLHSRNPDSVTKRWVDACLQERGYRTVGWR